MAAVTPPVVKVYHGNPMLPDVSRVLACLHEKDVKFELINMFEGQHMNPDLIKFQASRAPVSGFEDGNTRLFESRAICRHIVDKYADRGNKYLLGKDLLERASIEQWMKSEEHSFDPPSWALVFHLAFKVEPDRALITQSERRLSKVLDVYEQRLGESKFLAGDEFSLADLFHLPNSHYLATSKEWVHLFESRKNVRNWWGEISSRTSWQEVVKILNERGLFKGTTAAKPTTQPSTLDQINQFLIRKIPDQPASTGEPSRENQEKDMHQLRQRDSAKSAAQQVTTNDDKSLTQAGNLSPSSNQEQKHDTLPIYEEDFTNESIVQQAPRRELSAKDASNLSAGQKQEHSTQNVAQQAPPDARSLNEQTSPAAIPSQEKDQTSKALPQRDSDRKSTTNQQARSDPQPSNVSEISNKRQEQKTSAMRQADSAGQSITQNAPSSTKAAVHDDQLIQKQGQEKTSTPEADSVGQSAAQDEPSDARSSSKPTTPVTLPTKKQDQRKTQPMNQENNSPQSTAREASTIVKPATTPSSTNSASPSQKREQEILPGLQAASVPTNGPQSNQAGNPGALSSKKKDENTQPAHQANIIYAANSKEAPTDAQAFNQSAASGAIQKKEQMNQANSAGQSTAPTDGQRSSQAAGTLGDSSSKKGGEDSQKIHQADSTSEFTAPRAPDNATPASDAQAFNQSATSGAPLIQKKEQMNQANSAGQSTAPTDGQQSSQAGTLGSSSSKKGGEDEQKKHQADSTSEFTAPRALNNATPASEPASDAQAFNQSATSGAPLIQKKEQINQANSAGQSTAPSNGKQSSQAGTLGGSSSKKGEEDEQKIHQADSTSEFTAPRAPDNATPASEPASTDAQDSKPASDGSSNQKKEQTTETKDQKDSASQSTSPSAPTDVKPANHQVYPPSNTTSNNSTSETNSTGKPNSEPTSPTQSAS